MKNIEYIYNTPQYILEKITPVQNMDILSIIILSSLIIILYLSIFYILPLIILARNIYLKKKQKDKQSKALKKIILQKDLEDEILKEL